MHHHKEQDERLLISFGDISSILKRSRKQIFYFSVAFVLIGMLWAIIKPVSYIAEGTFREKGVKQTGLSASSSLMNLLSMGNGIGSSESEASSLMVSRAILKEVAEKHHLQGSLQAQGENETLPTTIKSNLLLTWTSLTNNSKPILKEL